MAPASELEKRGGKLGLGLEVLLKNSGDGGSSGGRKAAAGKEKPSSRCLVRGLRLSRGRLLDGSEVGACSSFGPPANRFLLGVGGGGNSVGGVAVTTSLSLALLAFVLPMGLALRSSCSSGANEDHVGGCAVDSLLCWGSFPRLAPNVCAELLSDREGACVAASVAA